MTRIFFFLVADNLDELQRKELQKETEDAIAYLKQLRDQHFQGNSEDMPQNPRKFFEDLEALSDRLGAPL
jgi:hypothetical protein